MSSVPKALKYSKTHEWVRKDDETWTIGITDHAQCMLGDLVYVELPEVEVSVEGRIVVALLNCFPNVVEDDESSFGCSGRDDRRVVGGDVSRERSNTGYEDPNDKQRQESFGSVITSCHFYLGGLRKL